jgi:hypothetical protein
MMESKTWMRVIGVLLGIYLLVAVGVGWYWSDEPELFSVIDATKEISDKLQRPVATGSTTTATIMTIMDRLLHKRGGFISNDIAPPGIWLDNIPTWEHGALEQVRDLVRAMRDNIARSQSQSVEDYDLAIAVSRFYISETSWALPSAESEYRSGNVRLKRYLQRLSDPNVPDAQFYARADNLALWLETVETRLGSLSQRLSASVGQRRINTDLAGDADARQSSVGSDEVEVKTPISELDDVFYEARGSSWALLHIMKAVEVDFRDVLIKKNALVSVRQIIRELESTQEPVYSPIILNGSGFGFVANHSLVMASYISRANAAIINLRELLSRG